MRPPGAVRLARVWLLATVGLVLVLATWAFAPIMVFVVLLTLVLGLLSAGIIWLANRLRDWRDRNPGA